MTVVKMNVVSGVVAAGLCTAGTGVNEPLFYCVRLQNTAKKRLVGLGKP